MMKTLQTQVEIELSTNAKERKVENELEEKMTEMVKENNSSEYK